METNLFRCGVWLGQGESLRKGQFVALGDTRRKRGHKQGGSASGLEGRERELQGRGKELVELSEGGGVGGDGGLGEGEDARGFGKFVGACEREARLNDGVGGGKRVDR